MRETSELRVQSGSRDRHLDGLRGVAALIVVLEHLSALLPVADWHFGKGLSWEVITAFLSFPFRAGNFAVYIFFVMSGLVVSKAARGKPWPLSLVSRYIRLSLPMLAASLLAWVLLTAYPGEMPKIGDFRPNYWTTNLYQDGTPSLWQAISEALYGAYATLPKPKVNPVLWSMRVELWGSLGIFTFYRFAPSRARKALLGLIAFFIFATGIWSYLAFIIGMAIAEHDDRMKVDGDHNIGVFLIVAGVAIAAIAPLSAFRYYSQRITTLFWFEADLKIIICTLGATSIVIGVLLNEKSRSLLTTKIPQFLGNISYSLYLTHMPILYTVFAAWYLTSGQPPSSTFLFGWIGSFLLVAILVAYGMTILVDRPSTRITKLRRIRTN
jgi:peptidoglycan/LPS O-acetylase OafA/YrhL